MASDCRLLAALCYKIKSGGYTRATLNLAARKQIINIRQAGDNLGKSGVWRSFQIERHENATTGDRYEARRAVRRLQHLTNAMRKAFELRLKLAIELLAVDAATELLQRNEHHVAKDDRCLHVGGVKFAYR